MKKCKGCAAEMPKSSNARYCNRDCYRKYREIPNQKPRSLCLCGCNALVKQFRHKYLNMEHANRHRKLERELITKERRVKRDQSINKYLNLITDSRKNTSAIVDKAFLGDIVAKEALISLHIYKIIRGGKELNLI